MFLEYFYISVELSLSALLTFVWFLFQTFGSKLIFAKQNDDDDDDDHAINYNLQSIFTIGTVSVCVCALKYAFIISIYSIELLLHCMVIAWLCGKKKKLQQI